jgi:uncharacterized alkaline shock family protein YloU
VEWVEQFMASTQQRFIAGSGAAVVLLVGLYLLMASLRTERRPEAAIVQEGPMGNVMMTVPAVKQIIMKAARNVEGVREVVPEVKQARDGLEVLLRVMVNPDVRVPDMTAALQDKVSRQLEEIGGLKVAGVKVTVDDISAARNPKVR